MTAEHSSSWRRATWGALLLLALVQVQGQLPVIPEDAKTTVRQRVDYGYCPGMVVGLMNSIWDGPIVDPGTAAASYRFYRVFEP